MPRFAQTVSMVFPASANPAPLFVSISPIHNVNRVTVAPEAALPAGGATIKIGVLKQGGNPATLADYNAVYSLTAGDTKEIAAGTHIGVWGLSGGTGGTVLVGVFGDRVGD